MNNWTDWIDIDFAKSKRGPLNNFGIYKIRLVNSKGKPIQINRLVGIDALGLIYIGRSGFRHQKTKRTIANRIREFLIQKHSGGVRYAKAKKTLKLRLYVHRLQVRGLFLPDREIKSVEQKVLRYYFSKHAELPPCNSVLPRAVK